jgi:hypothetical protein
MIYLIIANKKYFLAYRTNMAGGVRVTDIYNK